MSRRKRSISIGGIALLCVVILAGVVVLEKWNGRGLEKDPGYGKSAKSLVTTFKGDPETSRAFTWYSQNAESEGILQLATGTEAGELEKSGTRTFQTVSTVITLEEGLQEAVHKVEVTGLSPGTAYIYRVGDGTEQGWSQPAIFTTEGTDETAFTFLNVTDSQGALEEDFELWGKTLDRAFETFSDAKWILHNGDLTEEPEDEEAWDYFFGKAAPWLSRIPLMPVTGNHDEVKGDSERFTSHFNLPENGAEGSAAGTTYSFDYGNAHIVVMNTESNIKGQTAWLRQDLENSDKTWIIVAIHRPAYGGNRYEKISDWVPVFDEFGVDLVLQGHNHEYSRSFPLKNGEIAGQGEGAVYVVTNASGSKFNDKKKDKFYHAVHFQNGKQMFAGITVNGNRLTYQAYDVDGNKLDEFVLQKD
ncbi:purple acid phosphatase-like protein [Fontibacillus phaseoli]|uniref:Purple acid phosphatase-like protein n=1 Tax=Fontibacillus phaseoli TaxID=1416533 RepID=A0A369B1T9_9BACL|nr:fibronectin type III domain-containing protein [Fontibacillus phaseoli]RCX15403.1 purple acid phosphatase-like protein [Fontibacillus phaseoli]